MNERSEFKQFYLTAVPLDIAAILVDGDSKVLKALATDKYVTEYCLSTYAKLVYWEDKGTFAIFSYAHDGSDGWEAYEWALAEYHGMTDVSFALQTKDCEVCGTGFRNGYIVGDIDFAYVCSVDCGLKFRPMVVPDPEQEMLWLNHVQHQNYGVEFLVTCDICIS